MAKSVLITGCSTGGIGHATATRLAAAGSASNVREKRLKVQHAARRARRGFEIRWVRQFMGDSSVWGCRGGTYAGMRRPTVNTS